MMLQPIWYPLCREPRSAIETGAVRMVLPISDIAGALVQLVTAGPEQGVLKTE